jgi:hypothetical protein
VTITVRSLSEHIREVTRDDSPTAYLLSDEALAEIGDVRNQDTRWKLIKSKALATRKKQEAPK